MWVKNDVARRPVPPGNKIGPYRPRAKSTSSPPGETGAWRNPSHHSHDSIRRNQDWRRSSKASGKLEDKVALLTGGDSGIGRAVAVLYAREGTDVAIVYLPQEQSDAEETRRAAEAEDAAVCSSPAT